MYKGNKVIFKKQIHKNIPVKQFAFIGLSILIFLGIYGYSIYKSQTKPLIETPLGEMQELPVDVKQVLEKPTATPIPITLNQLSPTVSLPKPFTGSVRVPILLYHYVEYVQDKKDKIRQSLNINPNVFEQQVVTLQQAGYTFMTAKELGDVLDGKMPLPSKPVLLTFDDGHWDFDTVVLPILKKYHVKATVYIISGFLGGSDFMSSQQLQDVINSGLVDVGAHTVHHISLKGKLYPIAQYEVDQSKAMLENTYHIHVVSFAYPNGAFDQQAINIVKDAGLITAVSTIPAIEQSNQNRFFLYRLRAGYRTGQTMLNYLQQTTFRAY